MKRLGREHPTDRAGRNPRRFAEIVAEALLVSSIMDWAGPNTPLHAMSHTVYVSVRSAGVMLVVAPSAYIVARAQSNTGQPSELYIMQTSRGASIYVFSICLAIEGHVQL